MHFLRNRHHFIERGGDKPGKADHIRLILVCGLKNVLPGDHHAKINDLKAIALHDHADDILADIVHVALDRRHDDLALTLGVLILFRLDIGEKMRDGLLHHARGFDDLRQEHLARPEQIANHVHAVHQRTLDHMDRALRSEARFFRIGHDMRVDAFHQRMLQATRHGPAAPFLSRLFLRDVRSLIRLGERDQPLGRVRVAVEDHILARLHQFRLDRVIHIKLAGVDDRHVEPGGNGVVEKNAVHRPAHDFVAAKAEREVGEAA